MASRTRERYGVASTGSRHKYTTGAFIGSHQNLSYYEKITDEVAKGDGHNLDIKKVGVSGCLCNGKGGGLSLAEVWTNLQPGNMRNPNLPPYGHLTVPGRPTNAMLAADLLAKTNPSRPVVDLPIAVYELKDIPSLLQSEGKDWIRRLAALNLKYHFAIKPLVSDVINLLNFSDEVAKRQKELEALATSGLRRKRHLWDGSMIGPTDVVVNSGNGWLVHCLSEVNTSSKVWGFVEWFPSNPQLMKGDSRALARKAVLGLTVDFSTAWNAIPWSWLIDWCSNVGDILSANRNLVGAYHGPVRIMEQSTSDAKCTFTWTAPSTSTISDGSWDVTTKSRRTVVHVPISAQLPILNLRQLSILGSIAVTRRLPRS